MANPPLNNQANPSTYLPYIDGLRAIAVCSVILFHFAPSFLPGGFLGVDLFFVISGYVVSRAASTHGGQSPLAFILAFYSRRMARIVPPLLGCLLLTFIFTTLFIPPAWLTQSIDQTGLWAYWGASNIALSRSAGSYFSPIAELNPFTHTWSLAIEEQFYLLFALTFFLWNKNKKIALVVCSAIALSSFIYAIYITYTLQQGYYSSLARGWELALGVLLFQWESLKQSHPANDIKAPKLLNSIGIAASFCVLAFALLFITPERMPIPGALFATIPALILLHLCRTSSGLIKHIVLETPIMQLIGKMSYSLYLWHWPVFVLFKWTIGFDGALEKIIALLTTLLLSIFSYGVVERGTRQKLKLMTPSICIGICIAVTALCYFLSAKMVSSKNILSQSQVVQHPDLWYPNALFNHDLTNPCSAKESAEVESGNIIWTYKRSDACNEVKLLNQSLYVLGDSHALQYRAMFAQLASRTGVTVYLYGNGGCPFMSLLPEGADQKLPCKETSLAAYDTIAKKISAGDFLFLSSLRTLRRVDQWGPLTGLASVTDKMNTPQTKQSIDQDIDRFMRIMTPLADRGVHLIISAPTPTWGFVPFRCADWFNQHNPICQDTEALSKNHFLSIRAPIMQGLSNLTQSLPHSIIWDALPTLCPNEQCTVELNHKPLYFDGDHLSAYANQLLEPQFEALLLSLKKK